MTQDMLRDALAASLSFGEHLQELIDRYEATGDHDHGRGPIRGRACPGGDCLVHQARQLLDRIRGVSPPRAATARTCDGARCECSCACHAEVRA